MLNADHLLDGGRQDHVRSWLFMGHKHWPRSSPYDAFSSNPVVWDIVAEPLYVAWRRYCDFGTRQPFLLDTVVGGQCAIQSRLRQLIAMYGGD